jgi:transglutaminase-like putative cysteine protease
MNRKPRKHLRLLDPNTASIQIPDGPNGVRETLKIMRLVVRQAKRDPSIRQQAASIVSGVPGKDWVAETVALLAWVQQNIRYLFPTTGSDDSGEDAFGDLQILQTPQETLRQRCGACVDVSVLLASLLESIGHPTGFKAVGFTPTSLTHVYVLTKIRNDMWVPCDATMSGEPPGWEPPGIRNCLVIYNG